MPRRGWSDAPAEWVQIVRGPRPKSVKWPMARRQNSTQPASAKGGNQASGITMVRGRRVSQDGDPRQEGERGLPPDEVLANARARVTKLEAAIAAVGDSDPISVTLKEALSRAKSQAQERPVADRIKTHEHFHREGAEEGRFAPAGRDERPGSSGAGTGEVGKGRSVVARRRSPFASFNARSEQPDGVPGCPSHGTVQFCFRAGAVKGMCGRVAVGAGRPPCQVAEFQSSRGQGAQAAQDSGIVHSRFGSVESNCNRQIRAKWRSACQSSLWCFRQDGDTHRQRRFVSAHRQPFQSVVFVKSLSAREQAKYGLRGIRIGRR